MGSASDPRTLPCATIILWLEHFARWIELRPTMVRLPSLVAVPTFPRLHGQYYLRKLATPRKIRCSQGDFLVEYDIVRALTADQARKVKRPYTKPLKLKPEKTKKRWDLRVNLRRVGRQGKTEDWHWQYHRVAGLTLAERDRDATGKKLQNCSLVPPGEIQRYEIDHLDWDTLNCKISNLKPEPKSIHRTKGRWNWSRKVAQVKRRRHLALMSINGCLFFLRLNILYWELRILENAPPCHPGVVLSR